MDNHPPKKYTRFTIENLLGLQSLLSVFQSGSGAKKPQEYVERLEYDLSHNAKFNFVKSHTKFSIKQLPEDPEELLKGIFQHLIDEALDESRKRGIEPEQLGCVVSSPLLDNDIWVPVRELNENMVEAILNRFLLVAQSFRQKNVTLWGQPFTVTVTTVNKSGLPKQRQIPGSGRNIQPVHHRINDQSLIKACLPMENEILGRIRNQDSFFLFYALTATLIHGICKWSRVKFSRYLRSEHGMANRFKEDTMELMEHHLQSGFCKKSKQCEKCGVIWNVKDNTKRGRKGHVCGERHCSTCNDFHIPKRVCFIRPLESKDYKKYRIVAFDLETMQHQPSGNGKKHEPNFICAKVTCPECILKEEEECKVCGNKRIVTFSHKAFTRTTVDKMVVTPNPLEAFIDWLIDELPQEFDTIAFSHFGGRFDMVLVFKELFLRGKLNLLRK
uniref:DNA-directed DNA polymerase n=1 Tax=Meloidogyne javanica TaxID=6303 RepID=A0A915M5M7_MELJA